MIYRCYNLIRKIHQKDLISIIKKYDICFLTFNKIIIKKRKFAINNEKKKEEEEYLFRLHAFFYSNKYKKT